MHTLRAYLPLSLMLAVGCGDGETVYHRVDVHQEPPGGNCPEGGLRLDSGFDDDQSGALESGEVEDTQYVCNGTDGADPGAEPSGNKVVKAFNFDGVLLDDAVNTTLLSASVATDRPGQIVAIGTADTYCMSGTDCTTATPAAAGWMWLSSEDQLGVPSTDFDYFFMNADTTESLSRTLYFPLPDPGTHSFYLRGVRDPDRTGWFWFYRRALTVIFLPD
jgi:hypothetical protein